MCNRLNRLFKSAAAVCVLLSLWGCSTGGNAAKHAEADEAYEPEEYAAGAANYSETDTKGTDVQTDEKLVYTANLTIQTRNYAETVQKLHEQIKAFHGLIEYEDEYESGVNWSRDDASGVMHLNASVRIPAKDFENFQNALEGSGKIVSRSTSIENITRQYNDVSVEIEALQKQETRLLEMMDKAETIEDMITVETRLTEVQTHLNQLLTRRSSMDTDVEYSTISITIDEVKEYTEVHEDLGGRLSQGFVQGWKSFGNMIADVLVGILYLCPYILIVLAALLLGRKLHVRIPLPWKKNRKDLPEQ